MWSAWSHPQQRAADIPDGHPPQAERPIQQGDDAHSCQTGEDAHLSTVGL